MKTVYMETSDSCDNPIDLSCRCDSDETRKTPSPSENSSTFLESSPSFANGSPSSSAVDARKKSIIMRSDTPPNSYQSIKYAKLAYSLPTNTACPRQSVHQESSSSSSSPPASLQIIPHHHYKHESYQHQQLSPPAPTQINANDAYDVRSAALHQKLRNIPAKASPSIPSSPESSTSAQYPMLRGRDGKIARPFKAYKHDTLSNPFVSIPSATDTLTDPFADERYAEFHQQMIKQMYAANGGQPTITNPKMRRTIATKRYAENESQSPQQNEREFEMQSPAPHQNSINCTSDSSEASCAINGKGPIKDSAYYERRRKNNAAAKKSRDRRRMKEDNIVIRCAFLERENMLLKADLEVVRSHLRQYVSS